MTFFDPPMAGVADALRALRRDGVVVKILTGDNELVAQHVCGQVGLIGVILPLTPLAAILGLVPLPGAHFVFLGGWSSSRWSNAD